MSQRSFTSRAARPVLILGVSAAILSLGLSACSKQKSGSPNPSQGTPAPASSAAAPPASATAEGTPAPASPTSATAEPITRPRAGDCYQFPATDNSDDLTIVSCNQPHDAETFHAFEFRGDQFPTDDELNQASDEICGLMFEYYVGKPNSCKVVVNHTIELTEEEKAEARQRAVEQFQREELSKIKSRNAKPKKVETTEIVSQPSLFEF